MATITKPTLGAHFSQGLGAQLILSISGPNYPIGENTRWQFNLVGTESGSNAGSNLQLQGIADDGTTIISTAWTLTRSTGVLVLASSTQTAAGGSAGTFGDEGNINRQISSTGITPGTTAAQDTVLATYTLPASAFDQSGRGISITAAGSFAANADSKDVKIFYNCTTAVVGSAVTGGTVIADSGAVTTNGGGWELSANVFKYGAAASNTQIAIHSQAQTGGTVSALLAPQLVTAVESGGIIIAVTGRNVTSANDCVFNWLEVNFMN